MKLPENYWETQTLNTLFGIMYCFYIGIFIYFIKIGMIMFTELPYYFENTGLEILVILIGGIVMIKYINSLTFVLNKIHYDFIVTEKSNGGKNGSTTKRTKRNAKTSKKTK